MPKKDNNTKWLYIGGKKAGQIVGDTLRIIKKSQAHFVKKYQGYGVSPETLSQAEAKGAKYLHIIGYDREEFRLKIREFIAAATPDSLGNFGKQLFLSVRWLRWYSSHAPTYPNQPPPTQPGLFG